MPTSIQRLEKAAIKYGIVRELYNELPKEVRKGEDTPIHLALADASDELFEVAERFAESYGYPED